MSAFCYAQEYAVWKYTKQTLDFNSEPPIFGSDRNEAYWSDASVCSPKGELMLYAGSEVDGNTHFLNSSHDTIGQVRSRSWETYSRFRMGLIRLNDSIICSFHTASTNFPTLPGYLAQYEQYMKDSVGLFMTVLNTRLNNGGGGIVPGQRDIRISPLPKGGMTFHMDTDSTWWIITECKDSLYAYKLLRNGTVLPPVISPLNELEFPRDSIVFNPYQCEMRFSHDGKFFIRAATWHMRLTPNEQTTVYVYNFDEATGLFTNQRLIEKQVNPPTQLFRCQDIVFAPNDSLFYLIFSSHSLQKNLVQYNRFASNIRASEYCLFYNSGYFRYAELGQNSKIYLGPSRDHYSVIYRPNLYKDDCTLLLQNMKVNCNLSVSGNGCAEGDFPYSRFHGYKMNFDYRMNCDSTLQVLNLSDTVNLTDFSWYLYGPNNYLDSIRNTNPVFKLSNPGEYWLKFKGTTASGYQPWFSDSVMVEFLDVPEVQFSLANTKGCQFVNFSIKDGTTAQKIHPTNGQQWTWNFGDGTDTVINTGNSGDVQHIYTSTGNFIISLEYSNGYCSDTFTAVSAVAINDAPQPGIIADNQEGCYPLVTLFSDKYTDPIDSVIMEFGDGQRYSSLNHLNAYPHTYTNPGIYNAVQFMYGSSGCVSQDTIEIVVLDGFALNQVLELAYTTLQDQYIETRWLQIPASKYYALDRHDEITNSWHRVYSGKDSVFIDYDITPVLRYRYRVTAYDTCDQFLVSNEGSNIVLKGVNMENVSSVLTWNPYSLWKDGLRDYTILKFDPNTGFSNELSKSSGTSYEDFEFFKLGSDSVCYQVSATSNSNADWVSNSNVLCVRYSPVIWIPNSFTPNDDGLNEVFKPLMIGVRNEYYQFIVYDRWGAEIFHSTSKEEGWDGTFKSVPVPEGIYFYRISYSPVDMNGNYTRMNAEGRIVIIR